jgi:glycerol transport system permease protein
MEKPYNNRAWLFVIPVVLSVAFSAIIPLMIVINYSVQDIFGPYQRVFVGREWFQDILRDRELHAAFGRNLLFSLQVLAIEIPLGIFIARLLPASGWRSSLCLVLVALPLLIPWNVVGTIWQIFGRADIGMAGHIINQIVNSLGLDYNYNYTSKPLDAWLTVLAMDVWHWTPLVILLCYAGLGGIPPAFYQAAKIDAASAWSVFRFIELPKLRGVLMIAVLLRFMDSFMIYTEPFVVTGGGPGTATTFLSIFLSNIAVGQFDLGRGSAFSLVYFLIIQVFCYIFYTVIQNIGKEQK